MMTTATVTPSFIKGDRLNLTPERKLELIKNHETYHFTPTRFNFLNDHYGPRRETLHVLMASAGKGKSTLTRSIARALSAEAKVFYLSTEENLAMFETQLAANNHSINVDNFYFRHERQVLDQIKVGDEPPSVDAYVEALEMSIVETDTEIFFFDNITTSTFYIDLKTQSPLVARLLSMLNRRKVALFVIAHTASSVKDGMLLEAESVRGDKNLTARADFLYALQTIATSEDGPTKIISFLRSVKTRGYSCQGKVYRLDYDMRAHEFTSDSVVTFKCFADVYKKRDKL